MMLASLLQGHYEPPPLNPIARYSWVFPWVETVHISGLGLFVGTTVILALRLMGVFFKGLTVSTLAEQVSRWINIGLAIMLATGLYLVSSDPGDYIQVKAFRVKMLLLVVAIVFHFTVIRVATQPALDDQPLGWRKLAGGASICIWMSVVLAGLWIGNL